MKQRITLEQLGELTDEQKVRLREMWEPQTGDFYYGTDPDVDADGESDGWGMVCLIESMGQVSEKEIIYGDGEFSRERCLSLLSIGQMIEIIDGFARSNNTSWDIKLDVTDYVVRVHSMKGPDPIIYEYKETLCDSLWEAVKTIL